MGYRQESPELLRQKLQRESKRATDAESTLEHLSAMKPKLWRWLFLGALAVAGAFSGGYLLSPPTLDPGAFEVLMGHARTFGPRLEYVWRGWAARRDRGGLTEDCELIAWRPPSDDVHLRLSCQSGVVYETETLRVHDQRLGGCVAVVDEWSDIRSLDCSESVLLGPDGMRGPSIEVDTVGRTVRVRLRDGTDRQIELAEAGPSRVRRPVPAAREGLASEQLHFGHVAGVEGIPSMHTLPISLEEGGRCTVHATFLMTPAVDPACTLEVLCEGNLLYSGRGRCLQEDGELLSFVDHQPTRWSGESARIRTDHDPIVLYSPGRLVVADGVGMSSYAVRIRIDS